MSLSHIEFQRELQKYNVDKGQAIIFTMLYERVMDLSQQVEMCARLLNEVVDSVKGFAELHEKTQAQIKKFERRNEVEGVSVQSEKFEN